jgi:D-amino-acid oxidase
MDVLVIGAGVTGLTTSLTLLRAGHRVRIWASALPPHTTSNVAAAVWYPYKAYPVERVTAWGARAYREFVALAANPDTGVILREVLDLLPPASPAPWWVSAVDGFRRAAPAELPPGYAAGHVFAAPVIDTGIYLDYLRRIVETAGGQIELRTVSDLAEAFAVCPVVVNCAGLGARELLGDHDLHASRGQVVRVRNNGFRRVVLDDYGLREPDTVSYIVPRLHDIVLGGTDDEGNESAAPDPAVTRDILRRCAALAPEFAGVGEGDIVSVACGLRPVRSSVRVALERPTPDRVLAHNYGHGGAGITLSWGCAAEIVDLMTQTTVAAESSAERV